MKIKTKLQTDNSDSRRQQVLRGRQQQRHRNRLAFSNDQYEQLVDAKWVVQDAGHVVDVDNAFGNVVKCQIFWRWRDSASEKESKQTNLLRRSTHRGSAGTTTTSPSSQRVIKPPITT